MIARDSSGNGYDLTYDTRVAFGVPGYVAGDTMVQNVYVLGSGFVAGPDAVDMSSLSGNDLFFNVWTDRVPPAGSAPAFVRFTGDDATSITFDSIDATGGNATLLLTWGNLTGGPVGIGATGVYPAGPHMVSVRLDIGALGGQFYLDGAPFGSFQNTADPMPNLDTTGTLMIGGKQFPGASPFYDEIAVGAQPTTDSDFSNLYAQAGNFAAYDSAQMAMVPEFYYHLNETGAGWHVGRIGMAS